ncbi:MAG: hypothetical protein PT937_05485 [Lactobacillaceae bacterium]|uniref:hypothetical protein n=1 Tax=Limosilactobacillus sp. TaxID=2773925 RepID=UPI002A75ACF7|nr:hypothetical protein [Limosilactobacillus sp.]MDD7693807.1 hypothetical protein [Lactobacillaceae bacterium]MDY2803308.1 hypothetical protein [Limosilactobacillus sp.]
MNNFEIKKDGLYINGAKVTAYRNLKIESDIDNVTKLQITLYGQLHGIDDVGTYNFRNPDL